MKHQITHLLLAILLFAGFATSAIRADEIEGTWRQEGQYKKFSKNYSSINFKDFSRDNKKLAVMENNCLRIIDLLSGKILDTFNINPEISIVSFAISKDFKYLSIAYDKKTDSSNSAIYSIRLNVYNLEIKTVLCDTVITYDFSDINALNSITNPGLTFINDIVYSKAVYSYAYGYSPRGSGSKIYSYNCANNALSNVSEGSGYDGSKTYYSATEPLQINYSLTNYESGHGGEYYSHYAESLSMISKNATNTLFSRGWYRSNVPSDPGSNITPYTPIGITADNKNAVVTDDESQIWLYSLEKPGTSTIIKAKNGNTKFPEFISSTILFPNDKAGKSILLLNPHGNNLIISMLNYETGYFLAIALVEKDYITTAKAEYMLDSNIILTITETGEFYLLDLEAIRPDKGIDICSDMQFCTTNDSVSFVVINPNSYTDISIDFGDGSSVSSEKAKHQYSEMGKYSITVKAKDQYSNEVSLKKEKYITVNQGVLINISTDVIYESDNKVNIHAKADLTGNYSNLIFSIKPANNESQRIFNQDSDTISGQFMGLGYYTLEISFVDIKFNKLVTKDTVLKLFGPYCSTLLKENYTNTQMNSNVFLFKSKIGYQIFYYFYGCCAMTIDTNYQIVNPNRYRRAANFWSVYQLSDANYYLSMSTPQGGKFSIYDIRKPAPMDSLVWYYNLSGFAFNDDTLATIDKGTNEIVLQSFKDITEIKRIHSNMEFKSQPLVFNDIKNKRVFLIDNSAESGITLYGVNQNYQLSKINTIDAQYLPDYKVAQTLKSSKNNVFEFIDTNCVITLDFNTVTLHSLSIPNFNIQQVVHISDTTLALLGIDADSVINVCLVDSNYTEKERITLPYRTGNVLFAEKNKRNQLDFAARTPIGNLYFCTVKISNDTGSVIDTTNNGKLFSTEVSSYPNPTTNSITVDYPLSNQTSVSIINESGCEYTAEIKSINTDNFSIDTSLLPDGLYFVQIQDGEINKSVKFMVKR